MTLRFSAIISLLLLLNSTNSFNQKQIWKIYTNEDQPYSCVVLNTLINDTLYVKAVGNTYGLDINSIKYIKHERKFKAGIGFLSGMLIGGVYMNYSARKRAENQSKFPIDLSDLGILLSTGIGIIGGGILGVFIGSALGSDEYYNFSKLSSEKKKRIIERLLVR